MTEENGNGNPESATPDLGKFKSVEALARAYGELEAEFTRRSQRLKALEGELAEAKKSASDARAPLGQEELLRAVTECEGLRARIAGEYLQSLKGVPLMTGTGEGVTAPKQRPASFAEAGELALGYLRGIQR